MADQTPPGSRFITVHPNGPSSPGHPVLISQDGTVLGGMGGKFNGKHLSELYSDYPHWEDTEGDQIPENLRHVNPAHNPHLAASAHFGPEFAAKVEGTPQYEGGKWSAQVRNPHLERAAKAGRTRTPEGGTITPLGGRGVRYSRAAPKHPGAGGYRSFALSMGRDLVSHILSWLWGEHQARTGSTHSAVPQSRSLPDSGPPKPAPEAPPAPETDINRPAWAHAPTGLIHPAPQGVVRPSEKKTPRLDAILDKLAQDIQSGAIDLPSHRDADEGKGSPEKQGPQPASGGGDTPHQVLPGFDQEPGAEPVEQAGGPGAKTHEQQPGEVPPAQATPPLGQYHAQAPVVGHEAEAAPLSTEPSSQEEEGAQDAPVSQDGSKDQAAQASQHPLQRIKAATLQSDPRAATAGWKLHLAAPKGHHDVIEDTLRGMTKRGQITHYKREGSGQEGKDFTLYAGSHARAGAAAEHIQQHLGHHLDEPHGETLADDVPLTSHVMGRFDVGAVDKRFHQYGAGGVPFLHDDMHALVTARMGGQSPGAQQVLDAEERAHQTLAKEYGAFYHGGEEEAPAEVSPPTSSPATSPSPSPAPSSSPAPSPSPAPSSSGGASKSGGLDEEMLQHVRDHIVGRQPVGHSVNVGTVAREVTGGDRAQAKALLDELAKRGVLGGPTENFPSHYAVQSGHGSSGPGTKDAPVADIRRSGDHSPSAPEHEDQKDDEGYNPEHHSYVHDLSPEERQAYDEEAAKAYQEHQGGGARLEHAKSLLAAVRSLGGLRASHAGVSEYKALPPSIKNKNSPHSTDTMVRELAESHPEHQFADADELHNALMDAGQVHLDHGINIFGKQKRVLSANERWRLEEQRKQARRDQRAQGGKAAQEKHMRLADDEAVPGGEEQGGPHDHSMEGNSMPRTPAGPYSLGDDDYGLPEKHLLPLHTPEAARRSWDVLDRMPGLSREEHDEAEDRILRAMHAYGGPPEHDPPSSFFAPPDAQDSDQESPDDDQESDDNDEQESDDNDDQDTENDDEQESLDDDEQESGDGDDGDADEQGGADADNEKEDSAMEPVQGSAAEVREADAQGVPPRIPVQFMAVGWGNQRDKHFYTEDAVRALVPHIQTQPKMFISHSDMSEVQRHGHRPLEQLGAIAVRESVRYDPVRRACIGEAVLRPQMREFVDTAQAAGDTIGISVDAKGLFKPGTKECVGWSQFYSADFVPKGGAGGFTLAVRESERPELFEAEKEFVRMSLLDTLSTVDVREANLALYEAIGREYAAANPVTETVREADTAEVERLVRENETLLSERDAVLVRLDEVEAERNREQVARFVDQLVRECGVDGAPQVAYVAKMFGGATCGPRGTYETREALEHAVRESAQEYLSTLPAPPPTGEITGLGGAHAGTPAEESRGEWVDPFKVVSDGMALIWGHPAEQAPAQTA